MATAIPNPVIPVVHSMCLAPCEFYLTELSHDGSAPGNFRVTRFPFASWCPSEGNPSNTNLIHFRYVTQPLDSAEVCDEPSHNFGEQRGSSLQAWGYFSL